MSRSRLLPVEPLVSLLLLFAVTVPTIHFHGRNYRADEINTAHAGMVLNASETAQWIARNAVHPPGWRILGVYWVKLVGASEEATRWLSALCTMLTLALVYRLGADLFDRSTGLFAVFLLGTAPLALFYMREFRPYAALTLVTAGLLLTFLRWVRRPRFGYALLFVLFGIAALQTHYFAAYLLGGLALAFLILVRWDRGRYLRAFGLFAAVALSFTSWMPPLLVRLLFRRGIDYAQPSSWDSLVLIQDELQIVPHGLGQLLLLVALLLPVGARFAGQQQTQVFRFGAEWRKGYVLLVPLFALVMASGMNAFKSSLTTRNLIILLPPLAVLLAFALRSLRWQAQVAIVALVAVSALTQFRVFRPSPPYREVLAFVEPTHQPDDRFLIGISKGHWLAYYLFDRLPSRPDERSMYMPRHSMDKILRLERSPVGPEPEALAYFTELLTGTPRVWYLHGAKHEDIVEPFLDLVQADFALYRSGMAISDRSTFYMDEYRRLPDDLRDLAHFGAAISLQGWRLPDGVSVRACQAVPFESWWRALDAPGAELGIGLVLADASGQGVAKVDAEPSGARTIDWGAGTYHLDGRVLDIPCDLPPGEYPLLIGLHDVISTEPLPVLSADGAPVGSTLHYLTTLEVRP